MIARYPFLLLLCLFVLISPCGLFAQAKLNAGVPPREVAGAKMDNDSMRIIALVAEAEAIRQVSVSESIAKGQEALDAAINAKSTYLHFKALMSLGVTHISSLEHSKSIDYFFQAVKLCEGLTDPIWKKRKAQALINIGGVHWAQDNFEKAKLHLLNSNAILKTINEPIVLADNLVALGTISEHLKELDAGLGYLSQAVAIYKEQNHLKGLSNAYSFIGDIYLQKGNGPRALYYKELNLKLRINDSSPQELMSSYLSMGMTHLELNNPAAAKPFLVKAKGLAEATQNLEGQTSAYRGLADCHEQTGRQDSALWYWKAYDKYIKIIYDKEKAQQIQQLELQYQTQQKEQENVFLKEQTAAAEFRNAVLMALNLFFILLVALIVWFLTRIRHKNTQLAKLNEQLQLANEELQQMSTEKKFLATLLAHDLRHPLTLIQLNLFELQNATSAERMALIKEMEDSANKIEEMSRRIMDVENLDEKGAISIELKAVNGLDILQNAKTEFEPYAARKHMAIQLEHPATTPLFAKADPYFLNRIINNLLSNAIKYAPDHSMVKLRLEQAQNAVRFLVIDQGPGLDTADQSKVFQQSQKLKPKALHGEYSMGYGLFIARRYVEAMGGHIQVESAPGIGATFIVELPEAPIST